MTLWAPLGGSLAPCGVGRGSERPIVPGPSQLSPAFSTRTAALTGWQCSGLGSEAGQLPFQLLSGPGVKAEAAKHLEGRHRAGTVSGQPGLSGGRQRPRPSVSCSLYVRGPLVRALCGTQGHRNWNTGPRPPKCVCVCVWRLIGISVCYISTGRVIPLLSCLDCSKSRISRVLANIPQNHGILESTVTLGLLCKFWPCHWTQL